MFEKIQLSDIVKHFRNALTSPTDEAKVQNFHNVVEEIAKFRMIILANQFHDTHAKNLNHLNSTYTLSNLNHFNVKNNQWLHKFRLYRNLVVHQGKKAVPETLNFIAIDEIDKKIYEHIYEFFSSDCHIEFPKELLNYDFGKSNNLLAFLETKDTNSIENESRKSSERHNSKNSISDQVEESQDKYERSTKPPIIPSERPSKEENSQESNTEPDVKNPESWPNANIFVILILLALAYGIYSLLSTNSDNSDESQIVQPINSNDEIISNNNSDQSISEPANESQPETEPSTNQIQTNSGTNDAVKPEKEVVNINEIPIEQQEKIPEPKPESKPLVDPFPCRTNNTGDLRVTNNSSEPKTVIVQQFVRSGRLGGDYFQDIRSPTTIQPGRSEIFYSLDVGTYTCHFRWGGNRPGTILPMHTDNRSVSITACNTFDLLSP